MAARSAVSEMLRTRGLRVLILIAYLDFDHCPTLRLAFIPFLLPSSCDFPSVASRPTRRNQSRHFQTTEARPGKPTGSTNIRGSRRSSPHKSTRGAGELGACLNV